MLRLKSIPLKKIFIDPNRSRPVDEDHALAIQAEIVAGQFIDPILVRHTPRRSKQPYELIDGGHRMRAMELLGEDEIWVVIAEADKDEAELMETGSNLYRHLTPLDRAVAIHRYRQAWERKHGEIDPKGGRPKNSANIAQISPIDIVAEEANRGFSVQCAERLCMSRRSVEDAVRIARDLPSGLIDRLRKTPIADNQSQLLRFARLPKGKRNRIAEILDIFEGDFDRTIAALEGRDLKPDVPEPDRIRGIVTGNWQKLGLDGRLKALDEMYEAAPEAINAWIDARRGGRS